MIDSYEEEDDIFPMSNSLHNFSNINIFSTSPLEKGIIFSKIENKITEEIKMNSEMQIKYHSVLEQIRINKIHKDYNRKIYDAVLLQLLQDVRMRYESKMWKQFINSF
jgi:hypothetical protein